MRAAAEGVALARSGSEARGWHDRPGGTIYDLTHSGASPYLASPLPVATVAQNSAPSLNSTQYNTPGTSKPGVAYGKADTVFRRFNDGVYRAPSQWAA